MIAPVFSVFLLIVVGYAAKKIGLLKSEDAGILNKVVVYLTLPAFIFTAIYEYKEPLHISVAKVPLIGFAAMVIVMFIAYVLGRLMRLERALIGAIIVTAAFGNTAFLGYPIVKAAFADKGAMIIAMLYDELGMALPLYTIGAIILAAFAGSRIDSRQILLRLCLPQLWAIPAGLILRAYSLPEFLSNAIGYLGDGTIPLVMISTGLSLSARSMKGLLAPAAIVCVLKLLILPFVTYHAISLGGVEKMVCQVTVTEAGMPTAMVAGILVAELSKKTEFGAGVVFLTTLMSVVTIPLMLLILGVG